MLKSLIGIRQYKYRLVGGDVTGVLITADEYLFAFSFHFQNCEETLFCGSIKFFLFEKEFPEMINREKNRILEEIAKLKISYID